MRFRNTRLCFLYKLLFAFGTSDRNLSFAPGHPYRLAASGALEILMFFVLDPVQKAQIFPVLLIALIGVSGKRPENRPKHTSVGNKHKDYLKKGARKKCLQKAGSQAGQ